MFMGPGSFAFRRAAIAFFFAVLLGIFAYGENSDPAAPIGMDVKSAFSIFGPPQEVFPFRGVEEWQDNVVFFYPDFSYLFWYENRIWQVRYDARYQGKPYGLSLGMSRTAAKDMLPSRSLEQGESLYFDVDAGKYPIRVRLVFDPEDRLSDIYVYRSDF